MTSPATLPGRGPDQPTGLVFSADPAPRATDQTPAPERRARISTVLLATDLTAASDDATQQALDLADSLDARLLVVNVIDPQLRKPGGVSSRVDQLRAEREPRLLEVVERARAWGVQSTYLLWTGEPGKSIVAAADAERADLIVVGTRGLARAGPWLLGSVSDHVVHHASCPVLVVR